jgi:hypothetical protein
MIQIGRDAVLTSCHSSSVLSTHLSQTQSHPPRCSIVLLQVVVAYVVQGLPLLSTRDSALLLGRRLDVNRLASALEHHRLLGGLIARFADPGTLYREEADLGILARQKKSESAGLGK